MGGVQRKVFPDGSHGARRGADTAARAVPLTILGEPRHGVGGHARPHLGHGLHETADVLSRAWLIPQRRDVHGSEVTSQQPLSHRPPEGLGPLQVGPVWPAGGYGGLRRAVRVFAYKGGGRHGCVSPLSGKGLQVSQGVLEGSVPVYGHEYGGLVALRLYVSEQLLGCFWHVPAVDWRDKYGRRDVALVIAFQATDDGLGYFLSAFGGREVV